MIDVAIIGAGLTGLALARRLQAQGLQVAVFEARGRPGGRILTDTAAAGGAAVDLGASWYWPETETHMAQLVDELGLTHFAQPDTGASLSLSEASRPPEHLASQGVHGGARRVAGGMGRVIEALCASLPADTVRLRHRVVALRDGSGHIDVQIAVGGDDANAPERALTVMARRVALAMPPRLVLRKIRFDPELPEATTQALASVPTWMAREAKSFVRYDRPFWLAAGLSGDAVVSHAQAMLREVWDACDAQGAALAGFHALPPQARPAFERSTPLLVSSQLAQLFGPTAQTETVTTQDWARDPWTCTDLDLSDFATQTPQAPPLLRRAHWQGRLFFAGTETARHAAGHMDGALESVARLGDLLRPVNSPANGTHTDLANALARFHDWVQAEREQALPRYRQHLQQLLSRQDSDRLTQRAVLATAEQTYTRALEQIAGIDLCTAPAASEPMDTFTQQLLRAFAGFSKHLVDHALTFNAGSCALSNFDGEHHPTADYLRSITADLAAAWMEFAWSTTDLIHLRAPQRVAVTA